MGLPNAKGLAATSSAAARQLSPAPHGCTGRLRPWESGQDAGLSDAEAPPRAPP